MRVYGVVGWKNAGKTGLMERLVTEITGRGFSVSTVKHAHHSFDVDHPGKDSHRHRVAGAREVRVIMSHRSRNGAPKLIGDLTLPATGRAVVKRIYTELGVLDPIGDAFRLVELAPGVDEATLRDATGAKVVA